MNRRFLSRSPLQRLALIASVAAAAAATSLPAAADESLAAAPVWPQSGFNAAQSWANPTESILTRKNVGQLGQLWSLQLGQFYVGSTTQADGVLYACSNLYGLSAIKASTGEALWNRFGLGGLCGVATLAETATYVTTRSADLTQSTLSALNRADGSTLWTAPGQAGNLGFQNPTLSGKRLYVSEFRDGVAAFDTATGATRWRASTGMYNQQAAVGGGSVFVSTWGNGSDVPHRLFAFSAADGSVQWSRPTDTANSQYPAAFANGRVFVGSDSGTVYAYDAKTGKPLWKSSFTGYVSAPLVAVKDALIVNTGTGTISALDSRNGKLRWRATIPAGGWVSSNMVLANGVLFFTVSELNNSHRLVTLDARTGQIGTPLSESLWGDYAQVTVVDGRVHVATNQGFLQVYGLKTGR